MLRFVLIALMSIGLLSATAAQADDNTTTTTVTKVTETPTSTTKTVETTVIKTPLPAAKEVVATPSGYISCFTISAGWSKDTWYPDRRICQYENMPEGVAWVEGYWACTQHAVSECTNWDWRPGHWVKTFEIY